MEASNRLCDKCNEIIWLNDKRMNYNDSIICSDCYDKITSKTIKQFAEPQHPQTKNNKEILTPSYYWKGGVDVIEFAKMHFPREQVKGFLRINSLKYLVRYEEKGGMDDLIKSQNYMRMLIELEEEANGEI